MKMNKGKFLKTELGSSLRECINKLGHCFRRVQKIFMGNRRVQARAEVADWCQAQWEVYKMAIYQFYGIEYCFTRTDEYFGLVTEDEKDWLFKVER